MTRSLLAVILLAASGTAASAGTYVGLGIGSEASLDASSVYAPDGRSARGLLGYRFGNLSIEGAVSGYGLDALRVPGNAYKVDSRTASAALKLSIPLGNNFEAFARGGLQRTWLSPVAKPGMDTLSGDGTTFSLGFEYRLNLVLAGASVFVDYTRDSATLTEGTSAPVDQTASMWTLGLTVAI